MRKAHSLIASVTFSFSVGALRQYRVFPTHCAEGGERPLAKAGLFKSASAEADIRGPTPATRGAAGCAA